MARRTAPAPSGRPRRSDGRGRGRRCSPPRVSDRLPAGCRSRPPRDRLRRRGSHPRRARLPRFRSIRPMQRRSGSWRRYTGAGGIVEAVGDDYSYGAPISSFTGIPTIVGKRSHELQWRTNERRLVVDPDPGRRDGATRSPDQTVALMRQYGCELLYVGDARAGKVRGEPAVERDSNRSTTGTECRSTGFRLLRDRARHVGKGVNRRVFPGFPPVSQTFMTTPWKNIWTHPHLLMSDEGTTQS